MIRFITNIIKTLIFCCFLVALAGFSAIATVQYIFATSRVEVPDLVGNSLEYANDLLTEHHLKLNTVDSQLDAKIPKDHILAQDPAAGMMLKKKQTVRIVVSKGAEILAIPDVTGQAWPRAKKILRQHKLRIGHVAYAHSHEVAVDAVVAQTPLAHSEASAGTSVDLLVSRGPYKNVMVMPDLVEEQLSYALGIIEKLGLVLSKVEHEEYIGVPKDTILSQVPKPGALIEEQNMVTLVVSTDGAQGQRGSTRQALPVQYQTIEYMVPVGRFNRELSVIVRNAEGVAEMYQQLATPGNLLFLRIPVVGETVAEIYLDGALDTIQRMDN